MKKLTDKQDLYCHEYLVDLNQQKAAIRAGYSSRSARQIAHDLMKLEHIQAKIAQLMNGRKRRTNVTADLVVEELVKHAFFDIRKFYDENGKLLPFNKWDDDSAAAIVGITTHILFDRTNVNKIKRTDPLKALELIGKHLAMFTDVRKFDGPTELDKLIKAIQDD